MRALAAGFAALVLLCLAACQNQVLPKSDLRSGLSQETVRARIGKEPERVISYALPEEPALQFTVFEYLLAPQENWPEQPYWVLFDENGLVSFGTGGLREAKARAYDSYYGWMASQGFMRASGAEQQYRAKLLDLYGAEINPEVDEFLAYRVEVRGEVDTKKIDEAEAGRLIYAKYVELDARNRTAEAPLLPPAMATRFAVIAQMGLDTLSARLAQRPHSGNISWALACESFANRLGTLQRCR